MKINHPVIAAAAALTALFSLALLTPRGVIAATGCASEVRIVQAALPDIPSAVAKTHPHGAVTLAVTVTALGHASDIKLVKSSGNEAIDTAVAHAARDSKYEPATRNCKPVSGGKYLFHADVGR